VTSDRRYGLEACGAGNAGQIADGDSIGPCPGCDAELRVCLVRNPITECVEHAMAHPVPFCMYFGETDPAGIERDVVDATISSRRRS
jgi:hypothetical protein